MNILNCRSLHIKISLTLLLVVTLISTMIIAGCDKGPSKDSIDIQFKSQVPDFSLITDTEERKRSFFKYLGTIVKEENTKVFKKRERLLLLYGKYINKEAISIEDMNWLEKLRTEYKGVVSADDPDVFWNSLLKRVDILPLELALTQAAKESGWGSSRFARRGNNLFGQWCFSKGCGLVPSGREPGATHEVQKFDSVKHSVRSYIRNLNTNTAYSDFRNLRLVHRQMGITPDGYSLVSELPKYSSRGEEYVDEVRTMILINMPYIDS